MGRETRHGIFAALSLLIFALGLAPGCTANQLRRHTIHQAATIHDIYQQQILDNLAMFVHNRGSYPYFSLIGTGTSTLTDSATVANTNGWARNAAGSLLYATAGLNPSVMRQQQGSWQTFPINDSVKLTVMRCVYHAAMDGCLEAPGSSCPDCANLFYAYFNIEPPIGSESVPYRGGPSNNPLDNSNASVFTGELGHKAEALKYEVETDIPYDSEDQFKGYTFQLQSGDTYLVDASTSYRDDETKKTVLKLTSQLQADHEKDEEFTLTLRKRPPIRGIVTPECLAFSRAWFCHGDKLPKHFDKCSPYGYYCGTYVWVPPAGIEQLTKLTLLIQHIAYYDPPQAGVQSVTTQKTEKTPGPKTIKLDASMKTLMEGINAPQIDRERLLKGWFNDDQPVESTVTTRTLITPPPQQPTRFLQPDLLNLQQDLRLLPQP